VVQPANRKANRASSGVVHTHIYIYRCKEHARLRHEDDTQQ